MKLITLEMQNFRQHLDSKVVFSDGVTGIIGSNGAGKSTVLEAIAWALYGAPAVRGTNDTIRSKASAGGEKVCVSLVFDLSGSLYKVTRTLDASGRTGTAVLEVDGRALRSRMSEVTAAIGKLLGMDYQAFFTSFFTGQKQIEFMSQMDGRQRANSISRMLGYDRLTRSRDKANDDRKGLAREIEGLERGLPDPEDLKQRKKNATSKLADVTKALEAAESAQKSAHETLEKLKPLKEASDQKAKRHEELTRRLEMDRADVVRAETRLNQLRAESKDLESKRKELDSLQADLKKFEQAKDEFKKLAELQKFEGERQRLAGQIASLQQDISRLEVRQKLLIGSQENQTRAASLLLSAENTLKQADKDIQMQREQRVAQVHSIDAQIKQIESQKKEIQAKRIKIEAAGSEGSCPTCERSLAQELPTVLANFDSQILVVSQQINALQNASKALDLEKSKIDAAQNEREKIAVSVDELRKAKSERDAQVAEYNAIIKDLKAKSDDLGIILVQLEKLPSGFDQAKYRELQKTGEELRPIREKAIVLKSALDRGPAVAKEMSELAPVWESKRKEILLSENALAELAFSLEIHEKLTNEYNIALSNLNTSLLELERQRGEVKTASAILKQIEIEENTFKLKLEDLKSKRSHRLYLQTLAEAFDKLRIELNDRIRPELEAIASELLATMTDGRYNVLEIDDSYKATIRDDGELKPVISGGEDDLVNLALRLGISQMIAERAGQSFSLLVLDEVFGSLDDVRRDNVVSLLQNLKNRFEQIILITHVESIHDAVDYCIWVDFDEKTKTSRLTDRSEIEQSEAGTLV